MSERDMLSTELKGRTALVTGAGRGIGRAIALELAQSGARVIACGRDRAALEQTASAAARGQVDMTVLAADITSSGFLTELDRVTGTCDVVVHNATHFPVLGPLEEIPPAEIERVLDVGVRAPLRTSAHVMAGMKSRGFGRIVFIGSIAGTQGAVNQVAYATAKSALHGLVKSMAIEGAPSGVTCNLVEPGLVLTERVLARLTPEKRNALLSGTPMGRAGTPEEIAHVVAFLASPRASYVTGAIVPVTGGLGLGLR
jgi:NAD(P)-dependent dehydrogenase (short-subunit alcohol dehydrogenase family)